MVVEVGGLPNEVVHRSAVDLGCRGVIDERDGCAVVVGHGLAGGGFHVFADFSAAVCVAEHVDVAVVEAGEDDDFGVHHGGDEAEKSGLESGMVDFEVGLHGLAAEGALGGVLEFTHIAGAVDVVESFAVHHGDVAFEFGKVLVGGPVGRQCRK